ncbi:MAG TPA: endopeptidase La [Candidatus Intestinimonas merdavium]|uniref:Lon protease n=1 Tax=Candidatus Intestinimonas merdavium TaxID=2838622 RepID=A0A9D1Z2P3_9FIRM|nr:endopeptidase La [Candidatus Intestinimonas merdavium]
MTSEPNTITTVPVLALRGLTIFPNMLLHFDVGRGTSIKALDEAMAEGLPIFLVAQRDLTVEEPGEKDLYTIGTVSTVKQILRLPGENVRVMVEGSSRGKLVSLSKTTPFLQGEVEVLSVPEHTRNTPRTEALIRSTYELFERYAELSPRMTGDVLISVLSSEDPGYIADYIAQNIAMRASDKQAILEELHPVRRLSKLAHALGREVSILELEQEVQSKVREQLADNQRDYVLREQLKVLRQELGEGENGDSEQDEYRARIEKAGLPEEAAKKAEKELARLSKQPFGSAEATVIRNYLDVLLDLPWNKRTKERTDVAAARKILDDDHYGLQKVKERILEFLAVRQLAPELKGQVICLVGPPGVGKTSIAMSVARATGRKLTRISLGGVHDEAEIRGHRKTYVGAMPGRIIDGIRRAGSHNPLLLLDEIDKLASDIHGDPASALLEVLDGEQNSTFRDNFLEVPFDLSEVFFITTANTTDTIPRPLLDRMEVIELTSYTDEEKLQITKEHLLAKERKRHGLKKSQLKLTDDAIRALITGYTRESGVRVLERRVAALCRKATMKIISEDVKQVSLTASDLEEFLGPRRYHPDHRETGKLVGVVNGLAWTQVGGEMLQVEVNVVPGSGKVELTGNLGDVMKESARAALSYIRSRTQRLGIEEDFYKTKDIHVHFPEGAVPKDGPSAGITITTAMVSALTGAPVRQDIAMTGEVTLRGRVLAIGGLREKTMAALRNGMKTVLIPADNVGDLEEIDQTVRAALHFVPVEHVDQVLSVVLEMEGTRALPDLEAVSEPAQGTVHSLDLKQ